MDFPAWATPGELRKIYSKARTLGADDFTLSDVDAVKGFLEAKSAGFDFVKAMKKLSFREPASCSIHCWQFMKVSELFEFEIETVTLNHFFQWVKSKFSQVVHFVPGNTFKVYYLVNIESWHAKESINDTTTLREKLLTVNLLTMIIHFD
eukprot:gene37639-50817_t